MTLPPLADIAHSLAAALDVPEVMERVSRGALQLTRAQGAYVEQVVSDRGTVEIVASIGEGSPPVGTRVAYPGSLTEEIIEGGTAAHIARIDHVGPAIAPYLAESCRGCSALIAPLVSEGEVLGTLVLLGRGEDFFGARERSLARTVGDLASVSLRRVRVLEESERRSRELAASEQRFRLLVDRVREYAIFMLDPEGRVATWNEGACRLNGYSEEEALGRHFSAFYTEQDRARGHPDRELEVAAREGTYQEEGWRVRRDGTRLWADVTITALRGAEGELIGFAEVVHDVTDRMKASAERERRLVDERNAREAVERRLREETALREAARSVSAAFTMEEVTARIVEGALRATGAEGAFVERIVAGRGQVEVSAATGIGIPPSGTMAPYEGSLTEHVFERKEPIHIDRLGRSGFPLPDHLARKCTDCGAVVVPMFDGGNAIGALFLLRSRDSPDFREDEVQRAFTFGDLAALSFRKVHLYTEAERRREELEHVSESRARLMRGFSHDVKNPLGAADGYLSLLEDGIMGEVSDEQMHTIGRVRASIGSALQLIEDLVAIAKSETGNIEVSYVATTVARAAEDVAEEYRGDAEAKGLEMEVSVSPESEGVVIESDPGRIQQVLGNLVSNAVKYTDLGRVLLRVEQRPGGPGAGSGRWTTVAVSDTGRGIPVEKQRFLFQEFSRIDPGEKGGAGLGLAISQRVAEALGGRITVQSRAGEGATFTLWLPLERRGEQGGAPGRPSPGSSVRPLRDSRP